MGQPVLAILPSGVEIEPLGDPASTSILLGNSLAEFQMEEARAASLRPLRIPSLDALPAGPVILVRDNALFTHELLREVVRLAREPGAASWNTGQLALARGTLTRFLEPLQSLPQPAQEGEQSLEAAPLVHRLWVLDGARPVGEEQLPTRLLVVQPGEREFRFPVQRPIEPSGGLSFPFTPIVFLELSHWVHVLRGNLAILLANAARAMQGGGWGLFKLILRARSLNPHRIMARANQIGRGCDIHPTAVIEGSVLGDRVVVGAHAIVRYSYLGDAARVGDGAQVFASVLATEASLSRMSVSMASVLYPGANAGHPGLQLSLLGRDAMLGSSALLGDSRFGGNVKVRCRGAIMDSGSPVLGCCLGHQAVVAFASKIAAGRAVPNLARIICAPEEVASELPEALPPEQLWCVRHGRLEELVQKTARGATLKE